MRVFLCVSVNVCELVYVRVCASVCGCVCACVGKKIILKTVEHLRKRDHCYFFNLARGRLFNSKDPLLTIVAENVHVSDGFSIV